MKKIYKIDIYCYESEHYIKKNIFDKSKMGSNPIFKISFGQFIYYSITKLLVKKYKILILMLTPYHISTWILLITKFLHGKKIILWGHGISIENYEYETHKINIIKKMMIYLADEVWFYTDAELQLWKSRIPSISAKSLDNTISNISSLLEKPSIERDLLRKKHNIEDSLVVIYCARFDKKARRTDLLKDVIEKTASMNILYIIIGDGRFKPDFSNYINVKDFGAIYDQNLKDDLFQLSDIYFQPGWVGLSIVEAMAYGKPIFTFERSKEIPQCVEYSYIVHNYNGYIAKDIDDLIQSMNNQNSYTLNYFSLNCKKYVKDNLMTQNMIDKASFSLKY
ncbi:glycosyltransferase [Spirosoma oryzae]|uniref:glycosyltransferase n=1 Tax=Spirosoma oryzae TaxID=1469603 RepID=UPI001FE6933E|nr:glycosyltransferase [Spirosoma oryzae]